MIAPIFSLRHLLRRAARLGDGGDHEVLEHLDVVGIDGAGIDLDRLQVAVAGDGGGDHAAAGGAGHLGRRDLGLRLLHRGLHLLHLPQHLLLVHDSSSISWASNASTKPRISAAS